MSRQNITILGAGITGIWQALLLIKRGHRVTIFEKSPVPFEHSASIKAGAMLAPYCEAQIGGPLICELGAKSLQLWKANYPDLQYEGSIVLAQPREKSDLRRFARQTKGHKTLDAAELGSKEPDLEGRFDEGLFFNDEAHLEPVHALTYLKDKIENDGGIFKFGTESQHLERNADWTLDCRGLAANDVLHNLRGVRGERAVIATSEVSLHRPIHFLHPRFPLYIVPWTNNRYMIGATVVETPSDGPVTLRSALELLSTAYAIHPAFGEAEILELTAGVRPAFPDNLPKIVIDGTKLYVNGLYRNGFLLAPILAEMTCRYIETGETVPEIFVENYFKR